MAWQNLFNLCAEIITVKVISNDDDNGDDDGDDNGDDSDDDDSDDDGDDNDDCEDVDDDDEVTMVMTMLKKWSVRNGIIRGCTHTNFTLHSLLWKYSSDHHHEDDVHH